MNSRLDKEAVVVSRQTQVWVEVSGTWLHLIS